MSNTLRHCAWVTFLTLALGGPASAQTVYTWQDTSTSWTAPASWNPAGPDWTLNNALSVAAFPNLATINNQPTVDANLFARGVSINNTGADWTINGTNTLTVTGPAGAFTPGAAPTTGVNGFDVFGGGTATINAPVVVGTSGQFWYATGNTIARFTNTISPAIGHAILNLRAGNGSAFRLDGDNSGYTGQIVLGSFDAGGSGRFQVGNDNALGAAASSNVRVSGNGVPVVFEAVGGPRTISRTVSLGGVNFNVDGSNDFTFAGPIINESATSARTITANLTGGAVLRFTNNIGIRGATDVNPRDMIFRGSSRIELSGVIDKGGDPVSGTGGLILGSADANTADTFVARLSGVNTYNGNTQILRGTLLIGATAPNAAAGALGNTNLTVAIGATTGTFNAAVLTDGPFNVSRAFNVRSLNSGIATIGGNTADVTTFFNDIAIGSAANATNKTVQLLAAQSFTVVQFNRITRFGGATTTYTGNVTLEKRGPGTAVLGVGGSPHDFAALGTGTGSIAVLEGRLIVNGTVAGGTGTAVSAAATLGGTGTINTPVTLNAGAFLDPGGVAPNSIGTLSVGGATNLSGTYLADVVGGGTPASDRLTVNGNVTLSGFTLTLAGGNTYDPVTQYILIQATGGGTVSGTFANFAQGALIPGGSHFLDYQPTFVALTPVPEPSTVLGIAGAGLLAAGLLRRRRAATA